MDSLRLRMNEKKGIKIESEIEFEKVKNKAPNGHFPNVFKRSLGH